MGQTIFESCEYDLITDAKPAGNLIASCGQDRAARQKRIVAEKLKKMGDQIDARYFYSNLLYDFVRDFGLNRVFGIFLTGIHGALLLKIFLS